VTVGTTGNGFYVADDGPGIPPDQRDDVFEYGYTTDESDGSGIGLALVRTLADAHGWTVAVTETHDGGTRFEFREVRRPSATDGGGSADRAEE
jgi:signal transduction histidine kinase